MRRKFWRAVLAVGVLTVALPGSAAAMSSPEDIQVPTVQQELEALYATKRSAYLAGDAELMRRVYSEKAVIAGEKTPNIVGIEKIVAAYKELLPTRRDVILTIVHRKMGPSCQFALDYVQSQVLFKDTNAAPKEGREVILLLNTPDGWRILSETVLTPGVEFNAMDGLEGTCAQRQN